MAAVPAALCWTLLLVFVSAEKKTITAKTGQNVTLTCRAPNNHKIIAVKWIRADLDSYYILLYHDVDFVPDYQHPSFKNRVDLRDRQMKDGDVSVIVKNVTTADEGRYKCRVYMTETRSWQLSSIYLKVVPPPGPAGGTTEDRAAELAVISVVFLLLVALLGFVIYKIPPKPKTQ